MTSTGMDHELGVVVPVRNGADLLAATVGHVRELAARVDVAVRICVVDDGSDDGTADVLARLAAGAGSGLVAVSQPWQGVAAARNAGIAALDTPWIAMLDVDDRWTEAFFTQLWPLARARRWPIVQGRLREIDPAGAGSAPFECVNLGTAVFAREVFDRVGGFDAALHRLEDLDWFIRAHDRRVDKHRIDPVVLHWIRRSGSLTDQAPAKDPLLVRVHRSAVQRRSAGLAPVPAGFPSAADYLGVPPSERERRARGDAFDELTPVREAAVARTTQGIRAFAVVRNERARVPAMLEHHRRLGVEEFFVVDNASDDGTAELLAAEPDVTLFRTEASFAAARCGTSWLRALLDRHGVDRWVLVLDADELVCFPGAPQRDLAALTGELDATGHDAALAVMVDLYPEGPVRDAVVAPGRDPLAVCGWFDRVPWTTRTEAFHEHTEHPSYFGGPRERAFARRGPAAWCEYTVSKVPLLRYRPELRVADNFHWFEGARFADRAVALLHWKFTSEFVDRAPVEAGRGEHWDGASQYRRYATVLDADAALRLHDPDVSVRYRDPAQLLELGVLRRPEPHPRTLS